MGIFKRISSLWFIIALVLFAFLVRIVYLFPDTIPFSFDHGKDSIAILHMVKTYSPKFIGPWTSIPGLYFGPGWYYLLAPAYAVTNGNPVSGALMMTLMVVLEVILAYKYFGKYEALIFATAPGWLIISKSAWNPFPMTLLLLLFMIILKKMKIRGEADPKKVFLLFLVTSLGFHFSAAFAMLWSIVLLCICVYRRVKVTVWTLVSAVIGFGIPFIPQVLFELKHDFVETKAVIAYFTQGETQVMGFGKIIHVITVTLGEVKLFILPEIRQVTFISITAIMAILLGIAIAFFLFKRKTYTLWFESVLLFVIPLFGFFFLHFNYWYITALMPVAVLFIGEVLRKSPKYIAAIYVLLMLVTPIFAYAQYIKVDKPSILQSREMLPAKQRAIEFVYAQSEGKPFSSYHYVPDIYDYSYQYLYIQGAFTGKTLPVEFSYQPGEISYIPEKMELLEKLPKTSDDAQKIFFIVEKAQNTDFLDAWWGLQKYGTIVRSVDISSEITVYEATPVGI